MGKALSKNEIKRLTKEACVRAFAERGCVADPKKAGTMKYVPISISGSTQRIAAIYGSRGGGASIWIKEEVFAMIRNQLDPDQVKVEDVDLFKRGFQWAIHFDGPSDPVIQSVAQAAVDHGQERWERAVKRKADDARRAETRKEREAERKAKRRNPWGSSPHQSTPYDEWPKSRTTKINYENDSAK